MRTHLLDLLDHRLFVPGLLLLAAALRALAILVVGPDVLVSDGGAYHQLAVGLAETGAYAGADGALTAYRPVGYPLFLSVPVWLLGPASWVGQLTQLAVQIAGLAVLWDLGRRTLLTERQARLALILLALHPNGIVHASLLQTEPLALLLTAGAALALVRGAAPLAGAGWGLLTLVKPPYVLLLPLLLPWDRGLRPNLRKLALAGAVGLAVFGPWCVRNSLLAGRPAFVASNGGANLRIAYNDEAAGDFDMPPGIADELRHSPDRSEWEADRELSATALDWLAAHPGQAALLVPVRVARMWLHDADAIRMVKTIRTGQDRPTPGVVFWPMIAVSTALYLFILACVVIACVRRPALLLSLPVRVAVALTVVHAAFFGAVRFHYVPLALLVLLVPLAFGPRTPPAPGTR